MEPVTASLAHLAHSLFGNKSGWKATPADWAPTLDRQAEKYLSLTSHGLPVFVPVRVFPTNGAVVLDEGFDGLGLLNHLYAAVELCPFSIELV